MEALCTACTAGPTRIEGHPGLWAQSFGANGMFFICQDCHALWLRTYSTSGEFAWLQREPVGANIGVRLPPLPTPDAGVKAPVNATRSTAEHWLAIQLSWKVTRRLPA